ncbi:MAG: efflux RND transporter periplasmic adaptor subunit [Alphaproteobacteria bacterium]
MAAVAGGAGVAFYVAGRPEPAPLYRMARVERGSVLSVISSTGTLTPVTTVQVGSQVSGKIKELLADFNSVVQAGDLVARIDSDTFEARARQAEAEVAVAKANVIMQEAARERAIADLATAEATLAAAEAQVAVATAALTEAARDLARKEPLFGRGVMSGSEVERSRSARDQAAARVAEAKAQIQAQAAQIAARRAADQMAVAQIETAKAQVVQREAALYAARIDLENTFIRSPVQGTVIARSVDIGQTVAASLQAPVLFTIAQDLREMQVEVSVDEADIGRVLDGQAVTFTVDAFPGREFRGRVQQVRKASKVIQNVVTYTVVVTADNSEGRLLPGMTANVQIIIDRRDNVLKVANAALRFRPSGATAGNPPSPATPSAAPSGDAAAQFVDRLSQALELSTEQRERVRALFAESGDRIRQLRAQGATQDDIRLEIERLRNQRTPQIEALLTAEQRDRFRALRQARGPGGSAAPQPGRVWIVGDNGEPQAVALRIGITDGTMTEIVGGELREGQDVIAGLAAGPTTRSSAPTGFRF